MYVACGLDPVDTALSPEGSTFLSFQSSLPLMDKSSVCWSIKLKAAPLSS